MANDSEQLTSGLTGVELAAAVGGNDRQTKAVMRREHVGELIKKYQAMGSLPADDIESFTMLARQAALEHPRADELALKLGFEVMTQGYEDPVLLSKAFAETPFAEFAQEVPPPTSGMLLHNVGKIAAAASTEQGGSGRAHGGN